MSKSIRLSPKHGVNPCIPRCFFCGKEKNMIALMGKLPGDAEAPMNAVIDYEPCDECAAGMSQGVALIGVTERAPDNRPPLKAQGGVEVYPTGQFIVARTEAAQRMFNNDSLTTGDKLFVEQTIIDRIMSQVEIN